MVLCSTREVSLIIVVLYIFILCEWVSVLHLVLVIHSEEMKLVVDYR